MIGQNGGGDGEFDRPLLRLYGYTSGPLEKNSSLREFGLNSLDADLGICNEVFSPIVCVLGSASEFC